MSGAEAAPGTNQKETSEMTKVTCDMAVSVDGFAAGPNQTADKPFGDGPVDRLTQWMFEQREANAAEIDAIVAAGAFIMGRNMFGPDRGEWDESWTGWWGDDPPYHAPVFVLAHRPRRPVEMQGGTTFTFVTDGIQSALEQAREAAGSADVAIDRQPVPRGRGDRRAAPARRADRAGCRRAAVRRRRPAERRASRRQRHRPRHAPHLPHGALGRPRLGRPTGG
jgi:dihydrofolate reductase